MADEKDVLSISAVINGKDIETGANEFIAKIREMQSAATKATDEMSDGFQFLKSKIEEISAVIDASRQKLVDLSAAIGGSNAGAGNEQLAELKAQVDALQTANTELKNRLSETSQGLSQQGEAAARAKTEMDNLGNATDKAGKMAAFKEAQEDVKAYEGIIRKLNTQLESLYNRLNRLEKARGRIQDLKPSTSSGRESKDRRLLYNEQDINETKSKIKEINNAIGETNANLEQSKQKMAQFAQEAGNASTKTTALRTQLRNARQTVAELILAGKQNTAEFGKAVNEANKLQAAFNKVSFAVSGKSLASNSFGMLATSIQGVTGAMSTYMGIAGLFTKDQKQLMEIQTKLQAVMSISMGVQQMLGAAVKISVTWDALKASALAAVNAETTKNTAATVAQAGATAATTAVTTAATGASWGLVTALKAVGLAIKSIPVIGWVLAAISAVIAGAIALYKHFTKLSDEEKRQKAYVEELNKTYKSLDEALKSEYASMGKTIMQYDKLRNRYLKLKASGGDLNKFLKSNSKEFDGWGVSIKNASDMENLFVKQTDAFKQAMEARAKATAIANIAAEAYGKYIKDKMFTDAYEENQKAYAENNKIMKYRLRTPLKAVNLYGVLRDEDGNTITDKDKKKEALNKIYAERDANKFMYDYMRIKSKNADEEYRNFLKKAGIKEYSGKDRSSGKSKAEREAENREKWTKYHEEIEQSYNQELQKLYEQRNRLIENESEKSLDNIKRNRDKEMYELDRWLTELAKKRRELYKNTHINAAKGNNEATFAKTERGQWSLEQWRQDLMKDDPNIKYVYENLAKAISENAAKDTEETVEKILDKYNTTERERRKKLKDLKYDIETLLKQLKDAKDEDRKQIQDALNDARRQETNFIEQKEEWQEYLSTYGKFLEKRKALEDKFKSETEGLTESEPRYKLKKAALDKALKELDFEQLKKNMNWDIVFGDLSKVSKVMLDELNVRLKSIIEHNKDLSIESIKEIQEKLKEVEAARSKYRSFGQLLREMGDARNEKIAREYSLNSFTSKDGRKIYEEYQKALASGNVKKQEELKGERNSYGATFGEALERANKATAEYIKKQYEAAEAQKRITTTINNVTNAFKNIKNTLGVLGVHFSDTFNKGFEEFTNGLSEFSKGFDGIDLSNLGDILSLTNPINDAALAVSAVTNTISGVVHTFEGLGKMLGLGADYSEYNKLLDSYKKISSIWDELISKKTEYIDLSYGVEAKKAYDDVMSIVKADEEALRQLIKVRGESGGSVGSHSINYRQNSWMSAENWTNVSNAVGKSISSVQDLQTLTAKELEKVKMADADFWSKLDTETREYYDKIISLGDTAEDMLDKLKEQLTATSFDSVYNDFSKLISNMDSSTRDFADNFTEYLKNAVLQTTLGAKYKDMLEDWYNDFAEANKDGNISMDEVNKLQESYMSIVEKAREEAKNLQNIYGWSSTGSTSGSQTTSFTAMTADKGEELNGRFAAIQISNQSILDNMKKHIAQSESSMSEMLEIQRTSVSHLANIAKNTNELYEMNARLEKIERNTRNL